MLDQQPQAPTPQFMRGEPSRFVATRARLSVTRTIRTPSADRPVMFFDFAYSRRGRQFDRNG